MILRGKYFTLKQKCHATSKKKKNKKNKKKTSYTSSRAMGAVNIISDKLGTNFEQREKFMRNKHETPQ